MKHSKQTMVRPNTNSLDTEEGKPINMDELLKRGEESYKQKEKLIEQRIQEFEGEK